MARSAKSRKRKQRPSLLAAGLAATGRAVAERPVGVGGVTAFAVTFAFVAANALWYQPHHHRGAFFETRQISPRAPMEPIDVTRLEIMPQPSSQEQVELPAQVLRPQPMTEDLVAPGPETAAPSLTPPDARKAVVAEVQRVLAELKLYQGAIDGLTGPQTDQAVQIYRERLGLASDGGIDGVLLAHLGAQAADRTGRAATDQMQTASAPSSGDERVLRIQAGLRAFGNQGIDLDGRIGPQTVSAITEFQSLFGLPETGAPDDATYAKMKEIGLTD